MDETYLTCTKVLLMLQCIKVTLIRGHIRLNLQGCALAGAVCSTRRLLHFTLFQPQVDINQFASQEKTRYSTNQSQKTVRLGLIGAPNSPWRPQLRTTWSKKPPRCPHQQTTTQRSRIRSNAFQSVQLLQRLFQHRRRLLRQLGGL